MKGKRNSIEEQIKYYELQKELLIEGRKKELAEIIIAAGGLALDSRLIAGFVAYAQNTENKDDKILKQMLDLGNRLKLPRKHAKCSKKQNIQNCEKD